MFVLDTDLDSRVTKWIDVTYEYLGIISFFMITDNLLNCFLRLYVFFMISLDKNIPDVFIFDWHFCYLNFCTRVILQATDCLSRLTDDETHGVVRHWDDISVWTGSAVRSHHALIQRLVGEVVLHLLILR